MDRNLIRRGAVLVSALIAFGLQANVVRAQSSTEGPLAAPEPPAPSIQAAKPGKPAPARHRKTAHAGHHAVPTDANAGSANSERRPEAQSIAHTAAPADPLSFGMKWNGSNDDARATRVQNYDGSAPGTGAEVGLKLHF